MIEQLISFKTAKLANEKEFFGKPLKSFPKTKKHLLASGISPTQSLLQKWLRDKHGIMIHVSDNSGFLDKKTFNYGISEIHTQKTLGKAGQPWDLIDEVVFSTYEKALEEGLYESLKLIKTF